MITDYLFKLCGSTVMFDTIFGLHFHTVIIAIQNVVFSEAT